MEYKTLEELGYSQDELKVVENNATIYFDKDYGYRGLNLGYEEICAILKELKDLKKVNLLEHIAVGEDGVHRICWESNLKKHKPLNQLRYTEDTVKVAPYGVSIAIDKDNNNGEISLNYEEVLAIYKEMRKLQGTSL